ncbi:hypothetical protein Tco_0737140, partial [Tanacetum coccineum]
QLEIQGEVITQEDMNLKLLRSLSSEWKTHALIWRNKQEIQTISLDDLYNNLKIYEPKISGSSNTSQNLQNVAFVSSNSTNSNSNINTNEADNTAYGVSAAHTQSNPTTGDNLSDAVICVFLASQPNSPQMSLEDLEQINPDDLEEMDLQWEMAMLTIRARRFIKRTGRQFDVNRQRENRGRENNRRTVTVETPTENALVAQDGIGGSSSSDSKVDSCSKSCVKAYAILKEQYDSLSSDYKRNWKKQKKERDELKLTLEKFQNSSKSLNNLLESQVSVKFKIGLGYNAASSAAAFPTVESFMNSSEMLDIIEDWNFDYDSEVEFIPNVEDKTVRPSIKKIKFEVKS